MTIAILMQLSRIRQHDTISGYRVQVVTRHDEGQERSICAKSAKHKRSHVPQRQGYWAVKKRESK